MSKRQEATDDFELPASGVTSVTPSMAALWLRRADPRNRLPSAPAVAEMWAVLTDPERPNPQVTIAFDEDGVLIQGIHMLTACVQADVAIEANVVTGVSKKAWTEFSDG